MLETGQLGPIEMEYEEKNSSINIPNRCVTPFSGRLAQRRMNEIHISTETFYIRNLQN